MSVDTTEPAELYSDANSLLRSLLASSSDCIKILDLNGNLLFMTEGGQHLMEVTDFLAIKGCPWPSFWEGQGNIDAAAAVQTAKAGRVANFQGFATTMAGTPKWWDVSVAPIFGSDGKPERLLSVSRDITAVRRLPQSRDGSEQSLGSALDAGADGTLADNNESRFKIFAQAMPNQVWSSTPDGQLDWFNYQVYAFSGLCFSDLAGTGWATMVHPDDIAPAASAWTKALASATQYQTQFRLRRADGVWRWHLTRALPIKNDTGVVTRWIGTNTDIEDQKAAEAELAEVEQRAAVAVAAADIGTWDLNPQSGVLKWDRRCYELFGLSPGQPVSFAVFLAGLHPSDREFAEKACIEAMRSEGSHGYDIEFRTIGLEDGVERWVSAKGKSEFKNGTVVRFIGTVRDISGLKRAEEQQRLLTRELEHRMKNTMAMVAAIANQTFRSAATLDDAKAIFEARLKTLNQAHDTLTRSSWTSAPMPVVVEGALAPHRTGEGRINLDGPAVELSARQALSLALALHELATNATKYGSLSAVGGTIDVTWDLHATNQGLVLRFEWRESDGPAVATPTHRGFGSRLIERTLSSDFGSAVEMDYRADGLVCRFEAKLSELGPDAG
ncbi:MAG: PAS domain-containing protein [Hyphomicrobiales bacterium]